MGKHNFNPTHTHTQPSSSHKSTSIFVFLVLQKEKTGEDPTEAKAVKLYMQIPPIDKMDAALSTLGSCE